MPRTFRHFRLGREDAEEMSARWDELMEQYNERKSEAGAGAAVPGPRSGQSGGSSCMPAAPHNKTDEVGAAAAAQEAAMNEAVMRSRREAESAREAARAAARLKAQQAERVDELRQKQSTVRCRIWLSYAETCVKQFEATVACDLYGCAIFSQRDCAGMP